ncbi:MAG: AarF/ABC1/UbiB kinase family protein, partial [Nitrospirae bacterium]|nr:AarF/ABC1/UbiB kinase family protein [Nitrospirota bacterium]
FSRILRDELNYIQEGHNAELFKSNFSNDTRIVVPGVYWDYTTTRVLTLEFVEGIKITRFDEIRQRGIPLTQLAGLVVESYVLQIFEHHFFHGDPHPGNLFVQEGPRLVFVDFGLMQRITSKMQEGLRLGATSIIQRDIPGITRALVMLGFISRTENLRGIEQVVHYFMDEYRDMTPKEFRNVDIQVLGEEVTDLLSEYPSLQIPNNFILVGRTLGMLNGLNSKLDPSVNIIDLAKPHAKRFVTGEEAGAIRKFLHQAQDAGRSAMTLPRHLETFLETANQDGVTTIMINKELTGILDKIYRILYRTITGVLILGLIAVYIYLKKSGFVWEAWIVGGFTIAMGVLLVRNLWR